MSDKGLLLRISQTPRDAQIAQLELRVQRLEFREIRRMQARETFRRVMLVAAFVVVNAVIVAAILLGWVGELAA